MLSAVFKVGICFADKEINSSLLRVEKCANDAVYEDK